MAETTKQYIRRLLDYLGKSDPMKVLAASPGKLDRLVKGLSRAKARKRPGRGKWSIAEIVAHLADDEIVAGYRLRLIASKNGAKLQVMDEKAWAVGGLYNYRSVSMSAAQFQALRKTNLEFLKGLTRAQWNNFGRHPEYGKETIKEIVRHHAGHDINHLKQIAAMRKR